MRLTFLGTGSAMPTGHRAQSGYLVESDGDALLIDCGSGVLNALARTDRGYEGVDTVLLTHHHLDHVSDLDVLLKARWLAGETDLTIAGPPGTRSLVEDLLSVHEYMQDRLDLTLRDVDGPVSLAGFDLDHFETRHSMQCFAYRVTPTADGPTIAFSGDSEAFIDLVEFADGAAVFVHDCSFPDDVDVSNHPTPAALGDALAGADADIGRVYLTHLYPHTEGRHEEMLSSLGEAYDGDVRFAEDGLSITVDER
ncbi:MULTISPECIES: MBL fold metallo-hydrolase [Haloarcula]|uniref:MBL fold metallo-hydrolase n=1 Tax=Haloarcula pellucida TaxID=1427151 RepID=A0A830GJ57_9EURY|nr:MULTISPECIES: MBL fold metallo-hydrolase [Halomicroarcula]MBX0347664.1 MBL fold metallo-hydrolase [Halomicroarcula pellucida]MDS0276402.1 MBL fold metallo-hydrolase [Halomicroarcula sp. S1AR25-4]GGN89782.1 MBL fold metallo-hydrolase [Halomicroarcula pellucida]